MKSLLDGLSVPDRAAAAIAAATMVAAALAAGTGRADAPRTQRVVRSFAVADSAQPAASPSPSPSPTPDAPLPPTGIAVTREPTAVRTAPAASAPETSRLRGGIVLPVVRRAGGFLAVLTPCQVSGWVPAADVEFIAAGPMNRPSEGMELREATIVLDAGHGGIAKGAVGPGKLEEKEPNLAIVKMLAELLKGREGAGPGPRVVLTRDGDYDAGLTYRAQIANALGAQAFLSVHNNAEPDGPSQGPGTETYYQYRSRDSKRLAGLAFEETTAALRGFEGIAWMAERDAGAKYRLSGTGGDYYGLLRRSNVPASIVEVAFISNAPEEELLRRDDVRLAVAAALHRALVRYVTTGDPGSGFVEPYPRQGGPSGALPSGCVDPV